MPMPKKLKYIFQIANAILEYSWWCFLDVVGNVILDIYGHFDQKSLTQISATHAISETEQKSQNRIHRELDQKFGIPRIGTIH